jgi:protein-S-isoprenylcysteine O-methyltransferase Ste14
MLWKWIVFALVTLVILYFSWNSLRAPGSHGFYRFFTWECTLVLFLLNADYWFVDPAAPLQIVAWILLFGSLVPVVWGTVLLKKRGQPTGVREGDASLLGFEKTSQLVTTGIYAVIRHPLYSSLLILTWGIFCKHPAWTGLAIAGAATAFLYATARADEAECLRFFGPAYGEYMKKTRRFLPFIF